MGGGFLGKITVRISIITILCRASKRRRTLAGLTFWGHVLTATKDLHLG